MLKSWQHLTFMKACLCERMAQTLPILSDDRNKACRQDPITTF